MAEEASIEQDLKEIQQTRHAIASALDAIEARLRGNIGKATTSAHETVNRAHQTTAEMSDWIQQLVATAESVSRRQIRQHPWLLLSLAAATGYFFMFQFGRRSGGSGIDTLPRRTLRQCSEQA